MLVYLERGNGSVTVDGMASCRVLPWHLAFDNYTLDIIQRFPYILLTRINGFAFQILYDLYLIFTFMIHSKCSLFVIYEIPSEVKTRSFL